MNTTLVSFLLSSASHPLSVPSGVSDEWQLSELRLLLRLLPPWRRLQQLWERQPHQQQAISLCAGRAGRVQGQQGQRPFLPRWGRQALQWWFCESWRLRCVCMYASWVFCFSCLERVRLNETFGFDFLWALDICLAVVINCVCVHEGAFMCAYMCVCVCVCEGWDSLDSLKSYYYCLKAY